MKLSEYIGQDDAKMLAVRFMESWARGQPFAKAALFYGPPGVGKSSLLPALAIEFRTPLVKHNLSRDRNVKGLLRSATTRPLVGVANLVFLDECDKMTKSVEKEVVKLIKETQSPVIFACNYPQRIPLYIRKMCLEIPFRRPNKDELKEYALRLIQADGTIRVSGSALASIIGSARSFRQLRHGLEMGAPAHDADAFVEDPISMTEAMFKGVDLGLKPYKAAELIPWVYDNTESKDVVERADLVFAAYRRVGNIGHHGSSILSLATGGDVRFPWSLQKINRPTKKKEKGRTETKKVPTRGRGNLKLQRASKTIEEFL